MSSPSNIAARVARDLAEVNARLVSFSAVSVVGLNGAATRQSVRITRKWSKIDDGLRADYEAYLRANEFVTDPMVDKEVRDGRWKVIRVYSSPLSTAPEEQGVYQVLMYWPVGYGNFGDYCSESSPLAHTDTQVFFDSPNITDCEHEIKIGSVFSASNRLDPETGLWSGEKNEDISREYGAAFTSTSGTALQSETRTGVRNAAIPPNPGPALKGAAVSVSYNINKYGKIDWERSDSVGVVSSIEQLTTGGQLDEVVRREQRNAAVVPTIGRGDRGYVKNASFSINALSLIDWSDTTERGIEFLGAKATYGGKYETTEHEEGRNSLSPKSGKLTGDGYTRGGYSINPYGLYDWSYDAVVPVLGSQPVETTYGTALASTLKKANKNQATTANLGVGGVGVETNESFTINEFGLIDWTTTEETATAFGPVTATSGSVLASISERRALNQSTPESLGPAGVGIQRSSSFSINRVGKIDWSTTEETAIAFGPVTATSGGPLSTVTERRAVNSLSPESLGPAALGSQRSSNFSINRVGLIDWSTTEDVASASTIAQQTYGGVFSRSTQKAQENASAPYSEGVQGSGKITSGSFSINRYGLIDWRHELEEAGSPFAAPTVTYGGVMSTTTHEEGLNSPTLSTVAPGPKGKITRMAISLNRFGYYDWSKDLIEGKPQTVSSVETSEFSTTASLRFFNQTSIPAYPSASGIGTPIQNATISINEFGLYDGTLQSIRANSVAPFTAISGGPMMRVVETTKPNSTAPESPGAASTGSVNDVSNSKNEFGLYDARIVVRTPVAFDSGWVGYTDRYGTSYIRSFQNLGAVPQDGFTNATNNSLSFRKNEYGLYDGSASRVATRDGGGGTPPPDQDVDYTIKIAGVTYTIKEKITSSVSSAQAFFYAAGGPVDNVGGSGKTPGIVYIGNGRYKATKVTK